jgi:prepilin-type N-terminal cleavage/methylation domain-containing protein
MKRLKKKKGFSLVEMLVVVAIILLLIAMLVPVFTMVEEYVNYADCVSNMRNIYGGLLAYSNDYNGDLPLYNGGSWYVLTEVAMKWAYPAMKYLLEIPDINPYTGSPWSVPSDNGYFSRYLNQYHHDVQDILYCRAGDNSYYYKAYEGGSRTYVSNYVGYLSPLGYCYAVDSHRDYQSADPTQLNRPIRMGHDPAGTWLLSDIHWDKGGGTFWAPHTDKSKNILHLDGSVFLTKPKYWRNSYVWVDRFPEE